MPDSILTSTKAALGLEESYTEFDPEITMHINSVLADLNQLGVGPTGGFAIEDATDTWDVLLTQPDQTVPDPRLNSVKSYMFLSVKKLFDPPTVGYVMTAMEKMIEKAEWRITVAQDEITRPPQLPIVDDSESEIGEAYVLDGGAP